MSDWSSRFIDGLNVDQDLMVLIGIGIAFFCLILLVRIAIWSRKARVASGKSLSKSKALEVDLQTAAGPSSESPLETGEPSRDESPLTLTAEPDFERASQKEARPQQEPLVSEAPLQKPRRGMDVALAGTRQSFFGRLKAMIGGRNAINHDDLEAIEEILYTSDLGPKTVQRLLGAVEEKMKSDGKEGFEAVRLALKNEMLRIFSVVDQGAVESDESPLKSLNLPGGRPDVLLIVGVNGAGKTTTIGKLAWQLAQTGKKVLVAAGDTFRAAAGGQLKIWTERAQVEIFSPDGVSDPSAVAFMACQKAQTDGFDVVIIDTAGRLHTQKNLMEELKKMKRVITKQIPAAPQEVLLVLDANSGQNALIQAQEFNNALGVTGVVLTKLDGTAKGGVAVGLACEFGLPIKMVGLGEGIDDLRRFSSSEFVESII